MLEYPVLYRLGKAINQRVAKFDEDQPRDDSGKWTSTGGSSGAAVSVDAKQSTATAQDEQKQATDNPKPYTKGTGTKEDPIVTNDVNEAARALHENKHVKLDSPKKVSVLLDKIRDLVAEAKAKGEQAPVYDLCKVTVPGSSLFCAESKGIERVKMPQLGGVPLPGSKADSLPKDKQGGVDITPQFLVKLVADGSGLSGEKLPAFFLKATQNELNGAKVSSLATALEGGADAIRTNPILISKDNYIVDGHHRWAATVGVDLKDGKEGDLSMNVIRVDMDIIDLLGKANEFAKDWGMPQIGVKVTKGRCGNGGCAVVRPYKY